ncbi:MAG TPA: CbtB-domain containing protein [Methylocystis sp.]|nr:CbtB-domain containing protein [Methylocystis sp.]
MNAIRLSAETTHATSRAVTLKAAFAALLLGFGLIYLTGFSTTVEAHNAAHDARHAQGFPYH